MANLDSVKKTCVCVKCGKDITRSMKIYVYGLAGGVYCYDCAQTLPKKKKVVTEAHNARELYRRGYKVSEIARKLGCSASHVYNLLNGVKGDKREID